MKLVLAELLTAEGKLDEAENLAQSLLAAGARYPRLGLILGDIDLRSGNMEKSLTHYRAVLKAYPQSLPAKLKTGLIYYLQGDVVRAQEILAALEGEATSLPRVAGMQAFFSFGLFRLEEAEKQLKGLLKAEPSNQYLSKQLLATLLARRDYTAASALLGRTTGLDGVDKSMALGKIALGQFRATAEAHFLEAAARGSRGAEASELLLRFYLQANQGRKAQRLADSIAKKFPENPEALRAQGRADLFSGAFDSSRSWIDRALSVGKRHGRPPSWFSETLLLRGQTKQEQGKSRAAQKDYRLAKDRCPACAGPYWRLGLLLDEAGKSKAAINALRHALERDSRWPRPYYDLARAFDNAGKTEEAKRMYRKFLSFSPPAHLAKDARQAIAALQ
jgi:tetratricopeptide (TPR) repeat protein